mgnify:CR=1 FL=1|jgi:hypothetical protein
MSRTFTVNDKSYLEEDMNEEQKKMFYEVLNAQNDMASIARQHRSYEAYSKIMSQQLAHSLTSENDTEEPTSEDNVEETSEE